MKSPWLFIPEARPSASVRLLCFHHAGGSASLFFSWAHRFPAHIEVAGVQLPGRGNRIRETLVDDFSRLVEMMEADLTAYINGHGFALFGHSMGGLLAHELAGRMQCRGLDPRHLFVSAVRSPELIHTTARKYSGMSDPELIRDMRALGGTPDIMFENDELVALILPVIRADYRAIDGYRHQPGSPLKCPLTVMAGVSDTETSPSLIDGWKSQTSAAFETLWYPGDHFYLQTQEPHVTRDILDRLSPS